jgi:prepilin-type N-terminal cleavage/methylation domain-containing protein
MPPSSEQGFTLVEVLVALVVSAVLLAAISQASGLALARLRLAEQKRLALLNGSDLLTRATVEDYTGKTRSGTTKGLHWTSQEKAVALDPRGLLILARIHVTVSTADGTLLFDRSADRLKAAPR